MNRAAEGNPSGAGSVLRCPCCGAAIAPPAADAAWEEKRRHPRIEHRTTVRIDGRTAMLFNVSRGGLKLSSPSTPPAGAVDIEVEAGDETFRLKGIVRWKGAKRSFSNLLDFGVEVVDPPRAYLEFVERLGAPAAGAVFSR